MKIRALISLFVAFSLAPVSAVEQSSPLGLLPQLDSTAASTCSVRTRARLFSPLGALPADTDSFVVFSRLGEIASRIQWESGVLPAVDLLTELEGLAVGVSADTVADLRRLLPLFQILSTSVGEAAEAWKSKSADDVARAIVAEQRAQFDTDAETLVQASRDFHLAPIYFVLTAKEAGQQLLRQLSLLPMMLPIASDAPIEMTAKGDWRGFSVHGNRLDLSMLGLSPDQEKEMKQNLEQARLYVVSKKVGKRLVLVICSNLDEVSIPAKYTQSLLAAPVMNHFDSAAQQNPWAVGYSSASVVKMREDLDVFDYFNTVDFMARVFSRLGAGNEAYSAAAEALKSLRQVSQQFLPKHHGPERFVVWGEDEYYLQMVGAAGDMSFAPGSIRYADNATADKTAVYVESTALQAGAALDIPAVLNDIEKIQTGVRASLKPDCVAECASLAQRLGQYRPYIEAVAATGRELNDGVQGSAAFLFSVAEGGDSASASLSLCAGVADPQSMADRLQGLIPLPSDGSIAKPTVCVREGECVMNCGGNAPAPSINAVPVSGAALFAVNLPLLNKVVQQQGLQEVSSWIKRIEGALSTQESEFHLLLRLTPNK